MRLRQVLNWVNLSTLGGVVLARVRKVPLRRGPHGLLLAAGYPKAFPATRNPAVTVGDVVLLRLDEAALAKRPRLLDHEARHAAQWAVLVGPFGFLPLYAAGSLWSWLRTGHPGWKNFLEVLAGLADGGYRPDPARRGLLGGRVRS